VTSIGRYLPVVVLLACAGAIVPVQQLIDRRGYGVEPQDEGLYLTDGEALKRYSLGYDSLLADVYWVRAVQFFGGKVMDNPKLLNERSQEFARVHPLLDVTTNLDPHFIEPYRLGGFFVHDYVDARLGLELFEKGVRSNPDHLAMLLDLAFIQWTNGDCAAASETYAVAATKPGAHYWIEGLSASILSECGDYRGAIQKLEQVIATSKNERARSDALVTYKSYVALVDVRYLSKAAAAHHDRTGTWPATPQALASEALALGQADAPRLRIGADGAALDPNGVPYAYDPTIGTVKPARGGVELPRPRPRSR
jgi:hypothetical protein